MPFYIVRQDITRMTVDAIVNAANTELQMGGGVCGAIFHAAGPRELQEACSRAAPVRTGGAAVTPGFRLPARYVIHAVGPVYDPGCQEQCRRELYSAYAESLRLAEENRCGSVAFPLISSGIFGYPKDQALLVASSAIRDFLETHEMEVYLCVFDRSAFSVSEKLVGGVKSYIDEHYVEDHCYSRTQSMPLGAAFPKAAQFRREETAVCSAPAPAASVFADRADSSLDEWMDELDEPFSACLFRLIDAKGKKDAEVYKRANLDRKLFSKIRTGKGYTPRKSTILALAIALELSLDETELLLKRAGYALSHASKFDVAVEYFIVNGIYDIFRINEVLFQYDLPLLGA